MKATIYTKPIHNSKLRLFIDYYPPIPHPETGKLTRRETLKLFLYSEEEYNEEEYINDNGNRAVRIFPVLDSKGNPKKIKLTPLQRQHNKETYELAENIKAQRQLQIQEKNYGFISHNENADFLLFFEALVDDQKTKSQTNYSAVYEFLKKYTNGICPVSKLTSDFCEGFISYLNTVKPEASTKQNLSKGTIHAYWGIFKAALNKAVLKKLIKENPAKGIKGIAKTSGTHRQFLTFEELQKVASTPCDRPELKKACLFSALTGLRHSDILKLTWGEIVEDSGTHSIRLTIKKTKQAETLPISIDAYSLLGERKSKEQRVFPNFRYGNWENSLILRWVHKAGVHKHITFHCFRHTFATLQITLGTDLYTVSKMLTHKNISTTQIYAKIIDEKKREAANKITLNL